MEFEILKSYGLTTFVVVSVMGGGAWLGAAMVRHFTKSIAAASDERREIVKDFKEALKENAAANQSLARSIHSLQDRNTLEHKDMTQTQGQILKLVQRRYS